MLQYDLTETRLFDSGSRDELPTEAEMFVITVALLLIHEMPYTDLGWTELQVSAQDVSTLAECLEYRLSPLARGFGDAERLRQRLRDFVGLRIGSPATLRHPVEPKRA